MNFLLNTSNHTDLTILFGKFNTLHTGPEWNRFVQKLFWCFYSHKSSIFWAYIYIWYQIWIKNFRSFSTFFYVCKKSRSYFLVNAILFQIAITSTIFKLHRCVTTHWKANSPYFSLMVHFFWKRSIFDQDIERIHGVFNMQFYVEGTFSKTKIELQNF